MDAMIVASAQNTLHALNRVVSLLRGRDFHVESLAVGRSERSGVARVTIVIDATRTRPERVASCLERLEEVWSVRRVERSEVIRREVALIKFIEDSVPGELVSAVVGSGAARVIERSGDRLVASSVDPRDREAWPARDGEGTSADHRCHAPCTTIRGSAKQLKSGGRIAAQYGPGNKDPTGGGAGRVGCRFREGTK
jgi:acetolactate synthase I/III small subunit